MRVLVLSQLEGGVGVEPIGLASTVQYHNSDISA